MSLSTYYLEYRRHLARLLRRRAYAPTNNTASHDNYEKINSWVSFCFLYEYGAPLYGPPELRYNCVFLRRSGRRAKSIYLEQNPQGSRGRVVKAMD